MNTYLIFTLGDELFAIQVKYVLEVLQKQHITRVPKTPEHVLGIINFRGEILPVIDTKQKFNLKAANVLDKQIVIVLEIVTETDTFTIAAIADGVKDVMEFKDIDICPIPELGIAYDATYIKGAIRKNNSFILVLDILKIFSSTTIAEVKQLQFENL